MGIMSFFKEAGEKLFGTGQAKAAEAAGYHRYWLAEHHNMPSVACTSPTILIAHLAALTQQIHVGSGGVMLPNHAPLVVAEQFAMLEALHPGRVDVGIGRAPGTDQRTAVALRRSAELLGAEDFPRDLLDRTWGYLVDESGATTTTRREPGGHGITASTAGVLAAWIGDVVG